MNPVLSPFTKEQLIPQEERLEISHFKQDLLIGMPCETEHQEKRICLTPDAVASLTAHGHRIMVQKGAGLGSSFTDKQYSEAGAEMVAGRDKIFACPIIVKVAPPSLEEIALMKPQAVLISALQIKTRNKEYFKKLTEKKVTALAFEFIKDASGLFTFTSALHEISGIASVLIAAELLTSGDNKTGLLFGNITGVPPVEVVILGANTVGQFATRTALGLGANVKVFDNSISNLKQVQNSLGTYINTSTLQTKYLTKALLRCDVVIGALHGENRAPVVVSKTMVENMKPGSIIIDVSIDMGGCFETSEITSHDRPTFEKYGVTHYCVPNLPSRYSKTATIALSNIFSNYIIDIAESGGIEHALRMDQGLKNGVYLYHGVCTNNSVSEWFDLPGSDVNLLIF